MAVIGLTGGFATGKTMVTEYLKRKGVAVIDADELAREVVRVGEPAYRETVREFGKKILEPDGSLCRERLAQLIFDSPERREKLESIIHPRVYESAWKEINKIQARDQNALIVFSVPLLFESGHDKSMDRVVVVYADETTQIHRLMKRNGLTEAEARQRVATQESIDKKKEAADFVIYNTGTLDETYQQVDRLLPLL